MLSIGISALWGLSFWVGLAGTAGADPAGLRGLTRVALEIAMSPDLEALEDEVRRRVEAALGERPPLLQLDAGSSSRLRLAAPVHPHSASALRGFWLPFSGQYAIGTVQLAVERRVSLPGGTAPAGPLPARVWQAERSIAGPWGSVGAQVSAAVDDLLATFLADYRRARAP
ncbi:MAG: hypothetical protein ACREJV_05125 [Candidatus Rokuibacteriota bacterium]